MNGKEHKCETPEETFALGMGLGATLRGGEMILLYGGLGAGKTLFTKGILNALGYDIDEVTSPSFTLVNLYKTADFDVYHIDLWRLEKAADPAAAVGLNEICENEKSIIIIEWADRLATLSFPHKVICVNIDGDGDDTRKVTIEDGDCGGPQKS